MHNQISQIEHFLLSEVSACKVLVIGDVMLDIYYWGNVNRISPEAPVPIVKVAKEIKTLGGAGNVASNLAQLGCQVLLSGVTGDDDNRQQLQQLMSMHNIECSGIFKSNRPTITKTRIIANHQQIARLDFEEVIPLTEHEEKRLLKRVLAALSQDVNIVIVSDYDKGVCTPTVCKTIINECQRLNIPTIVDPKGQDWSKYQGADYITPNIKELSTVLCCHINNSNDAIYHHALKVREYFNIKNVLVTRSEKGLSFVNDSGVVHIPTRALCLQE
ncbi:MAG: hldE 3 [Firmicutes bacterium]|nr:hldE 3 [Bacillota bacterium]